MRAILQRCTSRRSSPDSAGPMAWRVYRGTQHLLPSAAWMGQTRRSVRQANALLGNFFLQSLSVVHRSWQAVTNGSTVEVQVIPLQHGSGTRKEHTPYSLSC